MVSTRGDSVAHLERALDEAGEDRRAARSRARAEGAQHGGRGRRADRRGRGVGARGAPGRPAAPTASRYGRLGWTRSLSGLPIDDVGEQFCALHGARGVHLVDSPGPVAALRHAWRGEIEPARAATTGVPGVAAERGEGVALRVAAPEPHASSSCAPASGTPHERLLDEWARHRRRAVPDHADLSALPRAARRGPRRRRRGASAGRRPRSDEAEARGYAGRCSRRRGRSGWRRCSRTTRRAPPQLPAGRVGAHGARGHRRARGVPGGAAIWSRRSRARRARRGPRRHRSGCGRSPRPRTIRGRWRARAGCEALIDDPPALADAADAYEPLGLRFDAARTRLALGRAQRRARQWGSAREALERAAADFDALGSPGWAGQARAELARVGGRRPRAAGELTADRAAGRRAGGGRADEQGDRAGPVRDRPHGRGAPVEHVREARRLTGAAREPPLRRDVRPIKIGVPRNFAEPGAAVPSLCVLPTGIAPERPRCAHRRCRRPNRRGSGHHGALRRRQVRPARTRTAARRPRRLADRAGRARARRELRPVCRHPPADRAGARVPGFADGVDRRDRASPVPALRGAEPRAPARPVRRQRAVGRPRLAAGARATRAPHAQPAAARRARDAPAARPKASPT